MAKIAVESQIRPISIRDQASSRPTRRAVACGLGWRVSDVICTAGPHDRPFEEQLTDACIAIVMAGSFQYRTSAGHHLMTPGSLVLGNAGQYFQCGHEHGVGDRCISFSYTSQYLEGLAAEAGAAGRWAHFTVLRVPPIRELSPLIARACARLRKFESPPPNRRQSAFAAMKPNLPPRSLGRQRDSDADVTAWEEFSVELAARAFEFSRQGEPAREILPAAEARVTRIVRMIESHPQMKHALSTLAQEVNLSRYHFLRIFRRLTGLTPHQYILRARLRRAATRLMLEAARVLDIALDCGFEDVSNFNHAFRAEFGVSPNSYRASARHEATVAL